MRSTGTFGAASLAGLISLGASAAVQDIFPDDYVDSWPPSLGLAARLYQCFPGSVKDSRNSVMVWADKGNRVLAVGSAFQGGTIPAYAQPIAHASTSDSPQSILVAAPGQVVGGPRKTPRLATRDSKLTCFPTSED